MIIKIILLALEAVLMWEFLRALPVICEGNILGIGVSAILMAITLGWTQFANVLSRIFNHTSGKITLLAIAVIIVLGIAYCVVLSVNMARAMTNKPEKSTTVVVLGCQVRDNGPSRMLKCRLDTAYDYLIDNPYAVCIVTGGQGENESHTEAEVMKEYLVEKGIDADRIVEENESTTTKENLENATKILDENGLGHNVAIVSDGFHLYRASMLAEDSGLSSTTISAPTESKFLASFWVREWLGLTQYYLFG